MTIKRALITVLEYLLGFFALAVFAAYAFAQGAPTPERFVSAFKLASCLAALELELLLWRKATAAKPINRLIIGANVWLIVGGAAAFLQQWWLLQLYQRFGEASLFAAMLAVGLVTAWLPGGFVGALGSAQRVRLASSALFGAVALALGVAVAYKGDVRLAAVLPVIALSWLNRALQLYASKNYNKYSNK
jgi:hypothetical protein